MKQLFKPLDYFFVLRPTLFYPVWTVFLAGFFVQNKYGVAANNSAASHHFLGTNGIAFIWVGLFLTMLMGAVFILNQIMDRKTDNKNQKLFLIAHGYLTHKSAFIESAALIAIAVIFAFIFSIKMGFLFLGILILTGWLYSFEPFKLKDRPLFGLVANGLGALLIFFGGWMIRGVLTQESIIYSIPYVCSVAAVYLLTTLPDVEGDASTQKQTFGVKFGFKTTVYFALFFEVVALVLSFFSKDELMFYPALFSLPFFIWASITLKMIEVQRAVKYSILLLTFTICVKWITIYSNAAFSFKYAYFFLLMGVYFLSKIYYKVRFGLTYPSLSV